ncbi:hypothetical protein PTKIN_Ptkin17bG0149700 [Pterospermum kingtungense]
MGIKRPFENEELQELTFKNPRQFDYSNKLTEFAYAIPHSNYPQKPHISVQVEGGFRKYKWDNEFETDALSDVAYLVDKDLETSAPVSLVTSTSSEEDTGSGAAATSPVSPEYFDFDFPRRTVAPVEDAYYLLLDRSPRRQIPLGPNHQANVPSWGRHMKKDSSVQNGASYTHDNDYEEIMMGTCIIPMPDSDLSANNFGVGTGRTDCSCLDRSSFRCVQQHVMEAREKLRKSLGHEKFVKLGFYDMGEDVAYKWSEEDEDIFREVVYNNPASLGKNFWKRLSAVFPSRSKRELVSYFFNVFILERRAVQNRSSILDIDSDDDEWHGSQLACDVKSSEEDEDSAIEFSNQEDLTNHEGDCVEDDDDDDDDDSDDSDCDSGVGDYGVNLLSKGNVGKSFDDSRFDPVFEQTDKVSGVVEDFGVQDDSCMSFEFHPNMINSHSLIDTKANLHVGGTKTGLSKGMQDKVDGSAELASHVYLLDTCDAKLWDAKYPTASTKGIDLQPTCNIIEEIFGQDTWDNKTRNE